MHRHLSVSIHRHLSVVDIEAHSQGMVFYYPLAAAACYTGHIIILALLIVATIYSFHCNQELEMAFTIYPNVSTDLLPTAGSTHYQLRIESEGYCSEVSKAITLDRLRWGLNIQW